MENRKERDGESKEGRWKTEEGGGERGECKRKRVNTNEGERTKITFSKGV